ncbi:Mur ligase [Schizophyllum amplum]|uniref:Dihydrofolate synthetase n=1 Tax=Schizophyllum amplum TaxID=97359 RepID=A0A550C3V6_9AGAR|nr:Mur ligase [Auriculariopsis ampla]
MSIDLSLDRIRRLSEHLPYSRPTIHIAGTNGKGSVSAIIGSILSAAGLSVGRFNSPHLVSICDCITLDGRPVDAETYKDVRTEVESANATHDTRLSNFELLTLTALHVFEHARVDVAVIEVGMGGRLDATNVIADDCILVSALAAVDLDHQAFLGDTVEQIAREKAGIARRGRPLVLGAQKHSTVEATVRNVAAAAGAPLLVALPARERAWNEEIDGEHWVPLLFPLHGAHQLENLGLAMTVISAVRERKPEWHITPRAVAEGVRSTVWPGRLSFHSIDVDGNKLVVLVDGAHNPASAETLAQFVTDNLLGSCEGAGQVTINYILALSHSPPKTPMQTLSALLPPRAPSGVQVDVNVALLPFTQPDGMPWVKHTPPEEMEKVVTELLPGADVYVSTKPQPEALREALQWVAQKGGPVILAGSLYLVADFYRIAIL